MAEDNNHEGGVGAAADGDGDDDIDQEEIRNLHIDGNFHFFQSSVLSIFTLNLWDSLSSDDDRFADAEEN